MGYKFTDCGNPCAPEKSDMCAVRPSSSSSSEEAEPKRGGEETLFVDVPRMSFRQAWRYAADLVRMDEMLRLPTDEKTKVMLNIIVRCMADAFCRAPTQTVRIGGVDMPAATVQDVYGLLDEQTVSDVMQRLTEVDPASPKAYIQTVLYDAGLTAGLADCIDWNAVMKKGTL